MSLPASALLPELYEIIISHVHDRATLQSCSLTCHTFLPPSRKNLFSTIKLDLGGCTDVSQCTHDSQSTSASLTHCYPYVRNVKIFSISWRNASPDDADVVEKHYAYLTAILPFFRKIDKLVLVGFRGDSDWGTYPASLRHAFVDLFLSNPITILSMGGIWGFPLKLFNCFSHLKQLKFHTNYVTIDIDDSEEYTFPSGRVTLDSLEIEPCHPESFMLANWLRDPQNCRLDIFSLKRYRRTWRTDDIVRIDEVSSTIEHLIIPSLVWWSDTVILENLTEIYFPNLQILELPLGFLVGESLNMYPYSDFSLHSQNVLKSLVLDYYGSIRREDIYELSWKRMGEMFTGAHLPHLETVKVRAENALEFREFITESFISFHERGMLKVEVNASRSNFMEALSK